MVNGFDQLGKRRQALEYVNSQIKWYTGLHTLLLSPRCWKKKAGSKGFDDLYKVVEEDVGQLYRYVIECQVKCVCTLLANVTHTIINTLRNMLTLDDWGDVLDNITEFERKLQDRANTCLKLEAVNGLSRLVQLGKEQTDILRKIDAAMRNILKLEEQKKREKAEERAREHLKKFDGTRYETMLNKISVRKEGTGKWLEEHEEYQKWKHSDSVVLIIEANPGRGKSVLAKSVMEKLKDDSTKTICYFFFTGGIDDHNKVTTALRAVLHQLFTSKPDVLLALGNEIACREDFKTDINALWDFFNSATKKFERGELVCIFDALDECDATEAEDLLQKLEVRFTEDPAFQLLVTTRWKDYLHYKLSGFSNCSLINLEDDKDRLQSLSKDVDTVIDQNFTKFANNPKNRIPEDKHKNLTTYLKRYGEQRTYLWVDLIFKYLESVPTPSSPGEWDEIFDNLPKNHFDVYRGYLKAVPLGNRAAVRRIFEIVTVAFEPLDVQMANVAVHIKFPTYPNLPSSLEISTPENFQDWINGHCGFLVYVFDRKLYFIHQTAREYLLSPLDKNPSDHWLHCFDISSCHRQAAERCIAYLSSHVLVDRNSKRSSIEVLESESWGGNFDEYPFFEYSALYWQNHIVQASATAEKIEAEGLSVKSILETVTKENRQNLAERLNRLTIKLGDRYQKTGVKAVLRVAIGIAELVVSATPTGSSSLAEWMRTLGSQLVMRFEQADGIEDLNRAIQFAEESVNLVPADHPDRSSRLNYLGDLLGKRFQRTGAKEDLDRAIQLLGAATSDTPTDSPHRAERLESLGLWLGQRFERTGATDDLDEAIALTRTAVESTPKNSPDVLTRLGNLASQLGLRFERKGVLEDLNEAIHLAETIVGATSIHDPHRGERLEILSNHISQRYKRTLEMKDIHRATELVQMAIEATRADAMPNNNAEKAGLLIRLARCNGQMFERSGELEDLVRGIDLANQAIAATPNDHPFRPNRLATLGYLISLRHERTLGMNDLAQAIELVQTALYETPKDHPDWISHSFALGSQLFRRFDQSRDVIDLERAITLTTRAVEETPNTHPVLASRLRVLGVQLRRRYELSQNPEDLERSVSYLKTGLNCANCPPFTHIALARSEAELAASLSKWDESALILAGALRLLPEICPPWLLQTDKEYILSQLTGLASMAAAAALNAGKEAGSALELLELGRALILNQQLEFQTDLTWLEKQDPDLANRYSKLRQEVQDLAQGTSSIPPATDTPYWDLRATRRRELDQELTAIIGRIRALPGFEGFLMPSTTIDFMAAADPDPIIVLNVSSYRCDAFIVEHHRIIALPLPLVSLPAIMEKVKRWEGENQNFNQASTLKWLWDTIASPCLEALGFEGEPMDDKWPHVWWVPTGPLSKLPIHAAGQHRGKTGNSVLDRVMSSYSVSLKTLIYLRQQTLQRPRPSGSPVSGHAVIVNMEEVPGLPVLHYGKQEVQAVEKFCASLNLTIFKIRESSPAVLVDKLRSCEILHFVGISEVNQINPQKSALILVDSSGKKASLTAGDVCNLRLQRSAPFLGYLSTCDAATMKGRDLTDEPTTLVSAWQLAGFRHVIGTLGSVMDEDCANVAEVFYETIADEGMKDYAVYRGIHRAVRALRDKLIGTKRKDGWESDQDHRNVSQEWRGYNTRWVSFVHYGV